MSPKNSNIQSQLNAWNARGMLGKLKSALHMEKAMQFSPGTPCIYRNEQATVIGMAGSDHRLVQTTSGQRIAAHVDDLQEIAKPFSGTEGAEQR